MRTSRVSRETAKLVDALTPSLPARGTRSARLSVFSAPDTATTARPSGSTQAVAKEETQSNDEEDSSGLSSANTTDIEDLLSPGSSRKRKRGSKATVSQASTAASTSTTRETAVKAEAPKAEKKINSRRLPARKVTSQNGEGTVEPPSNWETIYSTVKDMREKNPTAPVDTMGCSELYWRSSTPRERRLHILIALMLSSQTKDTVTAVAMQRLHTELGPDHDPGSAASQIKSEEPEAKVNGLDNRVWDQTKQQAKSTLTLENILAISPSHLNSLIGAVGFHNNKTKYIKATATILRDTYSSDIPPTATELMKLPGVGPKMAYLCMSAAWGQDEGIGVDVHVHRITNLWGWHKTKTPEETRAALEAWLPRDKWHEINKLLVGLGQTVCLPVARRCGECELAGTGLCKAEIKGWVAKEQVKKRKATKSKMKDEGGTSVEE